MGEFNLTHVVSVASTYVTTLNSAWSVFVAASFAAAGFGAAMEGNFTLPIAIILIIAYLTFAAAHLRFMTITTKKLNAMAKEVGARLEADPEKFTEYPQSAKAILGSSLTPSIIVAIHLTIDACVVAIIWASAQ